MIIRRHVFLLVATLAASLVGGQQDILVSVVSSIASARDGESGANSSSPEVSYNGSSSQLPTTTDDFDDQQKEYDAATSATPEGPSAEYCISNFSPTRQNSGLINGTHLSLLLALPLTFEGNPVLSPGFFQLASALMAIDHFNERNGCIVPELARFTECPVRIDPESLLVMDTGTVQNNAMHTVIQSIADQRVPHAIVGPYNELPATELSVVAAALDIPMVSHRGVDHNLLRHSRVTMVNPDLYAEVDFLGDYLNHTGRSDYIAVLYASNSDSAVQRIEAFRGVAHTLGMHHVQAFGYVSPSVPIHDIRPVQTVEQAMEKLAATGYRTIVWYTNDMDSDFAAVGKAAHFWRLDRGDHVWVIGNGLDLDKPVSQNGLFSTNTAEGQLQFDQLIAYLSSLSSSNSSGEAEVTDDEGNAVNPVLTIVEAMGAMAASDPQVNSSTTTIPEDEEEANPFAEIPFFFNSAYLRQAELLDEASWENAPFMKAWFGLNETFFNRLQQINPVTTEDYQREWQETILVGLFMGWLDPTDIPDFNFPPKDLFTKPLAFFTAPTSGCINLYDAIMSVGLGACQALANATDETKAPQPIQTNEDAHDKPIIAGQALQNGIRSVDFQGASGRVQYGDGFPGTRARDSITYAVFNMFPQKNFRQPFEFTEYRNATTRQWHKVNPFFYPDGRTTPPELLRDPADENYLSDGVRIAGLTLAGVAYLVVAVSVIWVLVYRHHSVVVASQPLFLVCLCLGQGMMTAAIILMSFDESHGWSVDGLSHACRTVPWLVSFGHIVTYNMLFTKLWRVNRVLQFSRRRVDIKHVIWPALLLECTAFVALTIWTATTDYGWGRQEIDETTGETMGKCAEAGDELGFWIPIALLAMIPTLLTGIMAWKTIDVDPAYSEAKWIFALILVQTQVIIVGFPLVVILEGVSTDGRYLGFALVLWTFPMTTMGLIIGPKMYAVHCPATGHHDTRGSSGGVRVTGISSSLTGRGEKGAVESSLGQSVISHQTVTQH